MTRRSPLSSDSSLFLPLFLSLVIACWSLFYTSLWPPQSFQVILPFRPLNILSAIVLKRVLTIFGYSTLPLFVDVTLQFLTHTSSLSRPIALVLVMELSTFNGPLIIWNSIINFISNKFNSPYVMPHTVFKMH